MSSTNKPDPNKQPQPNKKKYTKPAVKTEDLLVFGSLCNGSPTGGRKETTGAPQFCNSRKLKS